MQHLNGILRSIVNVPTLEMPELRPMEGLAFCAAGFSLQHPLKKLHGEAAENADAFVSDRKLLAIADGVSCVQLEGVDPRDLPIELLKNCQSLHDGFCKDKNLFTEQCKTLFTTCNIPYDNEDWPKHLLSRAAAQCKSLGSSTCLAVGIDSLNYLWSVNIGDSQMMQLRRNSKEIEHTASSSVFTKKDKDSFCGVTNISLSSTAIHTGWENIEEGVYSIVRRTRAQQHFFNCPFQVTRMLDLDCSYSEVLRRVQLTSEMAKSELLLGDLIIVGTDGLFDNLFDHEIVRLVNEASLTMTDSGIEPMSQPKILAEKLVQRAIAAVYPRRKAEGCQSVTPFSKAALNSLGRRISGGKPDDTTAVVALVVADGSNSQDLMPGPINNISNSWDPLASIKKESCISLAGPHDITQTKIPLEVTIQGRNTGEKRISRVFEGASMHQDNSKLMGEHLAKDQKSQESRNVSSGRYKVFSCTSSLVAPGARLRHEGSCNASPDPEEIHEVANVETVSPISANDIASVGPRHIGTIFKLPEPAQAANKDLQKRIEHLCTRATGKTNFKVFLSRSPEKDQTAFAHSFPNNSSSSEHAAYLGGLKISQEVMAGGDNGDVKNCVRDEVSANTNQKTSPALPHSEIKTTEKLPEQVDETPFERNNIREESSKPDLFKQRKLEESDIGTQIVDGPDKGDSQELANHEMDGLRDYPHVLRDITGRSSMWLKRDAPQPPSGKDSSNDAYSVQKADKKLLHASIIPVLDEALQFIKEYG